MTDMAARLGNVLYWLGCIVALDWVAVSHAAEKADDDAFLLACVWTGDHKATGCGGFPTRALCEREGRAAVASGELSKFECISPVELAAALDALFKAWGRGIAEPTAVGPGGSDQPTFGRQIPVRTAATDAETTVDSRAAYVLSFLGTHVVTVTVHNIVSLAECNRLGDKMTSITPHIGKSINEPLDDALYTCRLEGADNWGDDGCPVEDCTAPWTMSAITHTSGPGETQEDVRRIEETYRTKSECEAAGRRLSRLVWTYNCFGELR
jgi:hypothetical protein